LLRCRFSNIVFDEQQIVLYATLNEFWWYIYRDEIFPCLPRTRPILLYN
jgi:hypothetical protein